MALFLGQSTLILFATPQVLVRDSQIFMKENTFVPEAWEASKLGETQEQRNALQRIKCCLTQG